MLSGSRALRSLKKKIAQLFLKNNITIAANMGVRRASQTPFTRLKTMGLEDPRPAASGKGIFFQLRKTMNPLVLKSSRWRRHLAGAAHRLEACATGLFILYGRAEGP